MTLAAVTMEHGNSSYSREELTFLTLKMGGFNQNDKKDLFSTYWLSFKGDWFGVFKPIIN